MNKTVSEAPLEILVIGNAMDRARLSLPQQLVGVTFHGLRSNLKKPVKITNTNKEKVSDYLPSSKYSAVIIDPDHTGNKDDDWFNEARASGLLNGQKIFFLSRGSTNQREMRYSARTDSVEKLAYRIAGKK